MLMPRFMLDTDTCSYIMKRSHPLVLKRLQAVPVGDVCMSVVTMAELLCGVEVSPRRTQDAAAPATFLPYVEVLEFADDAALHYAEIRADLQRRGALIGANDLFIAAHARALGLTLVTNNTAEFERVSDLAIENWPPPRAGRSRPSACDSTLRRLSRVTFGCAVAVLMKPGSTNGTNRRWVVPG